MVSLISAEDLGLVAPETPERPRTYQALKQEMIAKFECDYLGALMLEFRGNVTRAARAAGKERRELARLLKKHGIDPQRFRIV